MIKDEWRRTALCNRLDQGCKSVWEPLGDGSHRTTQQMRTAMTICSQCPARFKCLTYGLVYTAHDDQGVYGGLTRKQLQILARMMREDGLDMRRRTTGRAERFDRALAWVSQHPGAIRSAVDQSRALWRKYHERRGSPSDSRVQNSQRVLC